MILGGFTAIGPRDANEDNFYFLDFSDVRSFTNGVTSYIMVSDGMGGYQGGDIASGLAVSSAESYLSQLLDMAEGNQVEFDAPYALAEISQNAHDAILTETRNRGNANMGATFIGAFLSETHAWIGHVGDSRAYLIRDGLATQLTEDHSQVGRMLSRGLITEEEAQNHPARNRIERALGFSDATPDITEVDLLPGDALLLCSDGVYTVLDSQALAECVNRSKDAAGAAKRVVKTAINKGTDDNSTAVVALCVGEQGQPAKRAKQPTIRTNAVEQPKHAAPVQAEDQMIERDEDALKGLDEFVGPELYDSQPDAGRGEGPHAFTQRVAPLETEQYRVENYRGRSSESERRARPSASRESSSASMQSRPKKAMVVPIAVGAVLLVAIVAIALFTTQCGSGVSGGAAPRQQPQQPSQQAAPSTAEQPGPAEVSNAEPAPAPAAQATSSGGDEEYTVGMNAELKYFDSRGVPHTFDETGAAGDVGFNLADEVFLAQGERVRASQKPVNVEVDMVEKSYYELRGELKQDLFNDLQDYEVNKQVSFRSDLSKMVVDKDGNKDAYRNLIKAISDIREQDPNSVEQAIDKLAVDEECLNRSSIPQQ